MDNIPDCWRAVKPGGMSQTKITALWCRMMAAAQRVSARHGWRAAARVRNAWRDWFHRQLAKHNGIDARLRSVFRPSQMRGR